MDIGTDIERACQEGGMALAQVISAVKGATEEELHGPSALDGWTRSHVLAHIDGVARAYARQVDFAAQGRFVEVYDGGRDGRDAAIESGARRSREEHIRALEEALALINSAWPAPSSPLWQAEVAYRDGQVVDVALGWWREACIHATDLDWGITAQELWSPALCEHLLDFLSVRLPAGQHIELDAFDPSVRYRVAASAAEVEDQAKGQPASSGPVTVTGPLASLAGWLAGRQVRPLPLATDEHETVDLPSLGPWPSK